LINTNTIAIHTSVSHSLSSKSSLLLLISTHLLHFFTSFH
jgi:hypothetical protein